MRITQRLCRRGVVVAAATACLGFGAVTTAAPAQAAAVTPFQIQPAAYGNPNGSLDLPPIRCGTANGPKSGRLTVTGMPGTRWGCLPRGDVQWINLTTGRTGTAKLSYWTAGDDAQATFTTGRGQVALMVGSGAFNSYTPGLTTVWVR